MVIELEQARTSFVNGAFGNVRFEWLREFRKVRSNATHRHRSKVKAIRLRRGETKATVPTVLSISSIRYGNVRKYICDLNCGWKAAYSNAPTQLVSGGEVEQVPQRYALT
jgi:hypothetical protein